MRQREKFLTGALCAILLGSFDLSGFAAEQAVVQPVRKPVQPQETLPDYIKGAQGKEGYALVEYLNRVIESSGRNRMQDEEDPYKAAVHYMYKKTDFVVREGESGVLELYSRAVARARTVNYGGKKGTAYCAERATLDGDKIECLNAEHLWPQSFFKGKEPMRSDLRAIRPAFKSVNASRNRKGLGASDIKTGAIVDITEEGTVIGADSVNLCDKAKGEVARALLYFALRYYRNNIRENGFRANEFWIKNVDTYLSWNRQFRPGDWEKRREAMIRNAQGGLNPFIDDWRLADRIGAEVFKKLILARPASVNKDK